MIPERNLDCIVGINGGGKTSISRAFALASGVEYLSASGLLKKYYQVPTSADLERFSQNELNLKFAELVLDLVDANPDKRFILDTHAIVFREDGTKDETFPTELYPYIKAIVDIIADPEKIIERVVSDREKGVRNRSLNLPDLIKQRIEESSARAREVSADGGFPYFILENNQSIDVALGALLEYIGNDPDKLLVRK